jgi:hypothetical protein
VTKRWPLVALIAAILIVLFAQTWHKAHRIDGNDLTSYLLSARALLEGRSPYSPETPFPYVYPMLLAVLLIPLAVLPYGAAVAIWFVASLAALLATIAKVTNRIDWAAAATAVVTFGIIQNTLLNGQVNFFVVLCCVIALCAARERRDAAAGAWLGTGIALKLMPAVLGMYFLVRGRWRAIAAIAVATLALSLGPALLLGDAGWRATVEYVRTYVLPMLRESPVDRREPLVFSVAGVVHGLAGPDAPRWITLASALGVLAAVTTLDILRWRRRHQDLAAGAAYMLAIVLISPRSEIHHLAFVIPAVGLCMRWLASGVARRNGWAAGAFVAAGAGLALARLAGPAHGAVLCAAIILLGAALAGLTPSSASPRGSRSLPSSSPSYRAAVP